jgi:hypothetical protein
MRFKDGDNVRIKYEGIYYYGEVTIARENDSKVIFEELNYDYYPNDELELMNEKDVEDEN